MRARGAPHRRYLSALHAWDAGSSHWLFTGASNPLKASFLQLIAPAAGCPPLFFIDRTRSNSYENKQILDKSDRVQSFVKNDHLGFFVKGNLAIMDQMVQETETRDVSDVDKGLVAMFLKMSPEERLRSNDNAVRAILELRNAFRSQKINRRRSQRTT